jgi:hypothetical protein
MDGIQNVPGGKVNILGDHTRIGHSKQKIVYEHVSYSERDIAYRSNTGIQLVQFT